VSRNQPIKIRGAAPPTAAPASVEDVKRAFYENASTPMTYWIAEMQLSPPQLIVCDDATSNLYRVPLTIKGSDITFGQPVEVQRVFTDVPAPAPAKAAASAGRRGTEAMIAAAISAGRIPASRAGHYRSLAASGYDISVLDTLAAAPGVGQIAANAVQDAEDADYRALFGGPPGRVLAAAAAPQASDEQVYQYLYGARPAEPDPAEYKALFGQGTAAAREPGARLASAGPPLTDDELFDELFGKEGSR
jgi:hypothetical protein